MLYESVGMIGIYKRIDSVKKAFIYHNKFNFTKQNNENKLYYRIKL